MSLITRCPACETMFKVVPDQLRISDGWVRCGQCGEIFDAARHLLPDPNSAVPAPTDVDLNATPAIAVPAAQPAPEVLAQAETPAAPRPRDFPTAPSAGQQVPEPVREPVPVVCAGEPLWVETVVPEQAVVDPVPVFPVDDTPSAPSPFIAPRQVDDELPDVSFMRDGKKKTLWHRPAVRIVLLMLVLLLFAAIAAQVLMHERDRIAAAQPAARPGLLVLCALSRCSLSPLRQIESIAIESSSFTLTRGDNYKLAFSLKNNALLDLAMPAIELSLTDAQDQPLIRRVILPSEFGAPSKPLAAGSDWNSSLSVSVKSTANMDRIAGYRMLAFYP